MRYISDPSKLANVVKALVDHEEDVRQYFVAQLRPRVMTPGSAEDRLSRLFILANSDRLGTGKGNESVKKATATFKKYLNNNIINICKQKEPIEAHRYFLDCLCDIKGMDQKTANLFLKYLVMFQDDFALGLLDWNKWKPHLHVPLDKWVLKLMGKKYLSVCGGSFEDDFGYKEEYRSPKFKTKRYNQLQTELREVTSSVDQPSITLDVLWFVGSKYCHYHPLFCDIYWLREYCWIEPKMVDWDKVPTTLKSTEREGNKEFNKAMRETYRIRKQGKP